MKKTIEELRTINTKNLLRFYKAERRRMYGKGYRYSAEDEIDGKSGWYNAKEFETLETFNEDVKFFNLVKTELNTRENVLQN